MSQAKLDAVVARCLAGELAQGSEAATQALWDVLCDPDDWEDATFASIEALRRWATGPRTERGLVRFTTPTVVYGDLIVEGDLECTCHVLVLGHLRCTGFVFTEIHDCLIVAGDLEARALEALRSYWVVAGDVRADTLWLSTYGFLHQRGAVHTQLLVLQQYFELRNDVGIHATTRIETDYLPDDPAAKARLREVLDVEPLLDDTGELDSWALLRAVSRGDQVLRAR